MVLVYLFALPIFTGEGTTRWEGKKKEKKKKEKKKPNKNFFIFDFLRLKRRGGRTQKKSYFIKGEKTQEGEKKKKKGKKQHEIEIPLPLRTAIRVPKSLAREGEKTSKKGGRKGGREEKKGTGHNRVQYNQLSFRSIRWGDQESQVPLNQRRGKKVKKKKKRNCNQGQPARIYLP